MTLPAPPPVPPRGEEEREVGEAWGHGVTGVWGVGCVRWLIEACVLTSPPLIVWPWRIPQPSPNEICSLMFKARWPILWGLQVL